MFDAHWVAERFDRRAPTYDRSASHRWQAERAAEFLAVAPGERVLDVATGTGLVAREVAARTGPSGLIVGTDLAPAMLRAAAEAADPDAALCVWVQADAGSCPFRSATFDAVACVAGVPYFPDVVAALREWRRVCRPVSRAAVTVPAVDGLTTARVLRRSAAEQGIDLDDPGGVLADPDRRTPVLREAGWQLDALDEIAFTQALEDASSAFGFVDSGFAEPLRTAAPAVRERVWSRFDVLYRAESVETHRLLRLRLIPAK